MQSIRPRRTNRYALGSCTCAPKVGFVGSQCVRGSQVGAASGTNAGSTGYGWGCWKCINRNVNNITDYTGT